MSNVMKITDIRKNTVYYIETDEDGWYQYTRHSAESWTLTIGESDEQIYDKDEINELETLFQNHVANNPEDISFRDFVLREHPDPDSVFGQDHYNFDQICLLAENYAKSKQVKLPTDEDIQQECFKWSQSRSEGNRDEDRQTYFDFMSGAEWMKEQIK